MILLIKVNEIIKDKSKTKKESSMKSKQYRKRKRKYEIRGFQDLDG
jgi:hypothetical protein